jgi:hypothetical protein
MKTMSTETLLQLWERGRTQRPVHRAAMLAAATDPEMDLHELVKLPAGVRDARLLSLRERMFGNRMEALAECPACGESVEMSFETEQVRAGDGDGAEFVVREGGCEVRARVPSSLDLAAIENYPDAESARSALLARCISDAGQEMPDVVLEALVKRMSEADPQADVQFALECPACAHRWTALFDIVSYLWREIDVWARRVLREVHTLASAYGWSEAEILSLSPWRRQFYLEMAGA